MALITADTDRVTLSDEHYTQFPTQLNTLISYSFIIFNFIETFIEYCRRFANGKCKLVNRI